MSAMGGKLTFLRADEPFGNLMKVSETLFELRRNAAFAHCRLELLNQSNEVLGQSLDL